ncbi:hypothetical protein ACFLUX_03405 [Chloroflexota bacterium]
MMESSNNEEIHRAIKRHQLEDSLRQECLGTISERITRYLELDFIEVTPNEQPFAPISAECILLYRDGHHFACIALCQAVAEALVRFLCEKNGWNADDDFKKNILVLLRRRKISTDCYKHFKEIWKGRNDYHHLNPKVQTERVKMQTIAKGKMIALHKVELEVFAFEWVGGAIKPKYPKYWPETKDGLINVFLRFEP